MMIAFAVNGVPAVFGGNSEDGFFVENRSSPGITLYLVILGLFLYEIV